MRNLLILISFLLFSSVVYSQHDRILKCSSLYLVKGDGETLNERFYLSKRKMRYFYKFNIIEGDAGYDIVISGGNIPSNFNGRLKNSMIIKVEAQDSREKWFLSVQAGAVVNVKKDGIFIYASPRTTMWMPNKDRKKNLKEKNK